MPAPGIKTEVKGERAEMGTAESDSKVTSSQVPSQSNVCGQRERSSRAGTGVTEAGALEGDGQRLLAAPVQDHVGGKTEGRPKRRNR